jgi:excinuclease Cho
MMRRKSNKQPEFNPSALYEYPQHLRQAIDHLPSAPGIYIFRGEAGDLPLYIGKSVNIRSRVLSHLRTEDEARMLRQTRSIDFERTAGEIGALLLEARLIKQLQPLYNQKLRRTKQLCSWSLDAAATALPQLVFSKELDFARAADLYGLFSSRRAALQALQDVADAQQLCYGLLGMERLNAGRGCFRSMLSQCAGACCGKESREAHDKRLRAALQSMQVHCWPYPGAVGLVERWEDWTQMHVIHHWCYLGSVSDAAQARALTTQASGFDADGYKILCQPLLSGTHELVPLWDMG